MSVINITKEDTNMLKGIAILLLLCHHLFYDVNGPYTDIHIYGKMFLVHELAMYSKLCVAIFVFLSGYGLAKSIEKKEAVFQFFHFYRRRLIKLLLNYWLIWILFVPIGVLLFNRTFDVVYVNHVWIKTILDFIGLANAFGFFGYNPTWWFMSLIIIMYSVFPLLWFFRRKPILLIVMSLVVYFVVPYRGIGLYLIHFVIGILCANYEITPPHQNFTEMV